MIEFINNQTIKFTQDGESDTCGCVGQLYCQPVRFTDETQFQIKGDVVNSDPEFGDQYVGWETWTAIVLEITSSKVSAEGVCDGTLEIVASEGIGPYEYNIGSGFGPSNSFTGLCEGELLVTVIDSEGHYASQYKVLMIVHYLMVHTQMIYLKLKQTQYDTASQTI